MHQRKDVHQRKDKYHGGSHDGSNARTQDYLTVLVGALTPAGHEVKRCVYRFSHLGHLLLLGCTLGRRWRDESGNHATVSAIAIAIAPVAPVAPIVVAWRVARHCNAHHCHSIMLAGLKCNGCAIATHAWHELIAARNATNHTYRHLPKICNNIT